MFLKFWGAFGRCSKSTCLRPVCLCVRMCGSYEVITFQCSFCYRGWSTQVRCTLLSVFSLLCNAFGLLQHLTILKSYYSLYLHQLSILFGGALHNLVSFLFVLLLGLDIPYLLGILSSSFRSFPSPSILVCICCVDSFLCIHIRILVCYTPALVSKTFER
jgi:hypothetical protein